MNIKKFCFFLKKKEKRFFSKFFSVIKKLFVPLLPNAHMGIKNAFVRTICIDSVEMPTNTRSGFTPIAIPEAKSSQQGCR